jgi:prepilin-type N-terminal cleavage/methylation domain-containing protein
MKRLQDKGFTLLEVLVALAIFGMLFGGLFLLVQQETRIVKNAADLLTARLLANEVMEILKGYPYDQLDTYAFTRPNMPANMNVQVFATPFGSDTLKKIVVTVRWTDGQGRKQYLALSTLRSKYLAVIGEGGK